MLISIKGGLVRDFMLKNVLTCNKNRTVRDCFKILFRTHAGAIIVTDKECRVKGIITVQDLVRAVAQNIPLNSSLDRVMTKNVYTINEDASFEQAKKIIRFHRIRFIPVLDMNQKLTGLVSIKRLADEIFES